MHIAMNELVANTGFTRHCTFLMQPQEPDDDDADFHDDDDDDHI